MSRLNKLYEVMETLRKEGLPVNEDLERKANELEEEIIKKEILPVLSKTIDPALQPVKRELVLVVDYVPGQPLSVHLSRKRNFAAELTDAKEMVLDPEVTHRNHGSRQDEKIERSPARDMTVIFPDGSIIAEKTAVETLVAVVKKIGVAEVRKVVEEYNLKFCRVPVISNRRDDKYGNSQRDLGNGWLLIPHSNNLMKKAFIEKLSAILGLGIKVTLKSCNIHKSLNNVVRDIIEQDTNNMLGMLGVSKETASVKNVKAAMREHAPFVDVNMRVVRPAPRYISLNGDATIRVAVQYVVVIDYFQAIKFAAVNAARKVAKSDKYKAQMVKDTAVYYVTVGDVTITYTAEEVTLHTYAEYKQQQINAAVSPFFDNANT